MADIIAGTPGCETAFLPAERLEDGRWSIGYVAGHGGTFPMLLPEGADPSALTVAEIQAAHDEAACLALAGLTYEGEVVPVLPSGHHQWVRFRGGAWFCCWVHDGVVDRPGIEQQISVDHPRLKYGPIAYPPGSDGWQPIGTAPKETRVLAVWPGCEPAVAIHTLGHWRDGVELVEVDAPTHWMPLPAPPKESR